MRKPKRFCSASTLAEMGSCERRVALEAKYGKRRTAEQEQDARRGDRAHEEFYREGTTHRPVTDASKPWCFVATQVYGAAAAETIQLRALRDRCLRKSMHGRSFIRMYYRLSPGLCSWMATRAWARASARVLLRPAVFVSRILVGRAD